jgi:hypothetical protein
MRSAASSGFSKSTLRERAWRSRLRRLVQIVNWLLMSVGITAPKPHEEDRVALSVVAAAILFMVACALFGWWLATRVIFAR